MFPYIRNLVSFYIRSHSRASLGEIFQPLYILLSVCGLFPYNIYFDDTKKFYALTQGFIFLNLIPAACIISALITFFVFQVKTWLELSVMDFSSSNYFLQLVLLFSFCLFAYASAFINRNKYLEILNTISSVWNEIPFCHKSQIPGRLKLEVNLVVIAGLFVITVVHLVVNFMSPDEFWEKNINFFTYTTMQLIQFVEIAYIYILLLMVISVLQNIREHTQFYTKKEVTTEKFWRVERKLKIPTISQLETAYSKAYDTVSNIKQVFQGPILVITIQCFHGMVTLGNIIYAEVVVKQNDTSYEVINGGIWIFWQFLKLYILAHTGSLIEQEVGSIFYIFPFTHNYELPSKMYLITNLFTGQ